MADTQSILQLGIEAARAGNKAEARELFRLVTREDPNNAQGWLWLAGVAEDREEKRVALERVLQADPSNQLAQKGLAALGGPRGAAPTPPVAEARDTGTTAPLFTEPTPEARRTPPPSGPASDEDIADAFDSIDTYAAAPESSRARTYEQPEQVGGYVPPDFGDEDYDLSEYQNRPRVTADDIAAREGDRGTTVIVEDEEPRRRGLMAWLPLVVVLLLVCLGGLYVWNTFTGDRRANRNGTGGVGAAETSTADTNLGGTTPLTGTTVAGETGASPVPGGETGASPAPGGETGASPAPGGETGASPAPGGETGASPAPAPGGETGASPAPAPGGEQPGTSPAPAPGGEQPGTSPAPAPGSDVASANPAIVPNTQVLRAGDFEYTYSLGLSNIATGSYGGSRPARGQYLIVLMAVRNVGATPQQIPDGFFVVKDAQGRTADFNRAASVEYINRFGGTGPGGAGDYAADAQLQPGAPFGSMPLLFDVASDGTDFVLFSRDNTSQGFRAR
ncbi:MAG TPA: hypothetical protein VFZ66_20170 [Herpetosiphonaceae bacterium]